MAWRWEKQTDYAQWLKPEAEDPNTFVIAITIRQTVITPILVSHESSPWSAQRSFPPDGWIIVHGM